MQKIELPGVVWVILIVAGVATVHEYQAYLPGDPIYWDIAITVLMGWLKKLNIDNDLIGQAFIAIEVLRTHLGKQIVRGDGGARMAAVEDMPIVHIPDEPSKMQRWLFG